ncbi:MAG: tyrosine-type recombinase/integrase [Candidatus Kaistia colombiensis]|nr:MAG: tyrosine-type recombinase/integrase [Kaistia sp.]
MPPLHVRGLRDAFASKLRMNGMALDGIQKLLGHSDPSMTQKYANLTIDKASFDAVDMLNAL